MARVVAGMPAEEARHQHALPMAARALIESSLTRRCTSEPAPAGRCRNYPRGPCRNRGLVGTSWRTPAPPPVLIPPRPPPASLIDGRSMARDLQSDLGMRPRGADRHRSLPSPAGWDELIEEACRARFPTLPMAAADRSAHPGDDSDRHRWHAGAACAVQHGRRAGNRWRRCARFDLAGSIGIDFPTLPAARPIGRSMASRSAKRMTESRVLSAGTARAHRDERLRLRPTGRPARTVRMIHRAALPHRPRPPVTGKPRGAAAASRTRGRTGRAAAHRALRRACAIVTQRMAQAELARRTWPRSGRWPKSTLRLHPAAASRRLWPR